MFVEAENYPILIHCIHGKDRTGTMHTRPALHFTTALPQVSQGFQRCQASHQATCSQLDSAACGSGTDVEALRYLPGAGIIVMLLLLLCGVKREAIVEDYMMSEKVLKQSRMHNELDLDGAPRCLPACFVRPTMPGNRPGPPHAHCCAHCLG